MLDKLWQRHLRAFQKIFIGIIRFYQIAISLNWSALSLRHPDLLLNMGLKYSKHTEDKRGLAYTEAYIKMSSFLVHQAMILYRHILIIINHREKIMDSRRSLLVIALLFISFLIYQQWEIDNNPQPAQTATQTQVDKSEVPTTVSNSSQHHH